jgi:hypothetical protein
VTYLHASGHGHIKRKGHASASRQRCMGVYKPASRTAGRRQSDLGAAATARRNRHDTYDHVRSDRGRVVLVGLAVGISDKTLAWTECWLRYHEEAICEQSMCNLAWGLGHRDSKELHRFAKHISR